MADEPPFVRPGPAAIAPGACPGGVVVHVYATSDPPRLLAVQPLGPGDDIEAAATMAAAFADDAGQWAACLVAYDGDTGERFDAEAWRR